MKNGMPSPRNKKWRHGKNIRLIDEGWEYGKAYKIMEVKDRNTNPMGIKITIRYRPVEGKREQVIIIQQ